MTIHRRSFMKGVAASAALPFIPKMPAVLGGAKTALATSRAWATHFNRNTYLQNNGGIARMPSALSYTGTLVFKYRMSATNSQMGIFRIGNYKTVGSCPSFDRATTVMIGDTGGGLGLHLHVYGPHPGAGCNGQNLFHSSVNNPPTGNVWHDAIVAWDAQNGTTKVMIDGATKTVTSSYSNGANVATDFTGTCTIGGNPLQNYEGDLTDIGLFAGVYTDPTNIVDQLYNVEGAFSERNASSGTGIIAGVKPQIWLSGPAKMFLQNYAAGTWNVFPNGTNSYIDTNPSSAFTVVGGPLTDADTDPFEA